VQVVILIHGGTVRQLKLKPSRRERLIPLFLALNQPMGMYHRVITHHSKVHPGGAVHHMVADGPSSLDEQHEPARLPMLLVLILPALLIHLTLPLPTFDADR
jgi:hypothetical protein